MVSNISEMNEHYHKQRNQKLLLLTAGIFVAGKKKDFLFIIIQEVYLYYLHGKRPDLLRS